MDETPPPPIMIAVHAKCAIFGLAYNEVGPVRLTSSVEGAIRGGLVVPLPDQDFG